MSELLTLPANEAAERAILGSCIQRPSLVAAVISAGLRREHYSLSSHGAIHEVLVTMHDEGKPIDLITVIEEIGDRADSLGGWTYISDLQASWNGYVLVESHVLEYVQIVMRKAQLRGALLVAQEIETAATAPGALPAQVIADAISKLNALSEVSA